MRELRSKGIQPDVILTPQRPPGAARHPARRSRSSATSSRAPSSRMETVRDDLRSAAPARRARAWATTSSSASGCDGARDLEDWRELVQRLKHPDGRRRSRHRRQVRRAARRLPVGARSRSPTPASRTASKSISAGCTRRRSRRDAAERAARRRARHHRRPAASAIAAGKARSAAAQYARTNRIPYLGLCLGMQVMVTEFARNVCGMPGANSTEMDPETPFPVISLLRGADGHRQQGRHHAPRRLPVPARSRVRSRPRPTATTWSANGTATASSSTTPTATRSKRRACA